MECVVCFKFFNEKERRPRILECGHTFCETCIISMINRRSDCAKCRKKIEYRSIEEVIVNYAVISMMDKRPKGNLCKTHLVRKDFYCRKCKLQICGNCVAIDHLKCGQILEVSREKHRIKNESVNQDKKQ